MIKAGELATESADLLVIKSIGVHLLAFASSLVSYRCSRCTKPRFTERALSVAVSACAPYFQLEDQIALSVASREVCAISDRRTAIYFLGIARYHELDELIRLREQEEREEVRRIFFEESDWWLRLSKTLKTRDGKGVTGVDGVSKTSNRNLLMLWQPWVFLLMRVAI